MLVRRDRVVDILSWTTWGFRWIGIAGGVLVIFFFFVAFTGQHIPDTNVDHQWRACKIAFIVGLSSLFVALGTGIWHRFATTALERYLDTHCANCDFNLGPLINERKDARCTTFEAGEVIRNSLFLDITCPKCKTSRVVHE